jgi:hypothetical protein
MKKYHNCRVSPQSPPPCTIKNERSPRVNARHFLIPWTGGAFAPLGPFLCPTTEENKWSIGVMPQSQGPMTCIEYMSLTLKRSLKNKICW